MEKIRLLIADDHVIFRERLRTLLAKEDYIEVVGEAGTGIEAYVLTLRLKPQIVIMDVSMPELDGIQAARKIVEEEPHIKVIILSISGDWEFVNQAIRAGVSGYVLKETTARELLKAIREVEQGNFYFSPEILRVILEFQRSLIPK
jgi:DNA-binding NarL/FixJ family response regulator